MKITPFNRFMILWAGQLMSGLGNGMTAFALGVYLFGQTGSVTSFALAVLSLYLPSILLRPLGGVMADRFDRRLMIIIGEVGSASGVIFILVTLLSGFDLAAFEGTVGAAGVVAAAGSIGTSDAGTFWRLYLGIGISSAFTALQGPAYKASVTDLLTEKQFTKAGGMVQLASSAQHLLSPFLAGVIMSGGSILTVLMIDLSTFFFSILAASIIRRGMGSTAPGLGLNTDIPGVAWKGTRSIFQELREGWATIAAERGVLLVILILSLITFFVGFVQTLFGPMILSFTDAPTLGMVQSTSATGMVLASLLLGTISLGKRHSSMLLTGLAAAGIALFLLGLSTNLIFITGVFFLFYSSLPFINTSADVLIRRSIPNQKQGRAWGLIGVLSQLGYLAAYALSGLLADRIFNPLFEPGGALASSIGTIIGTGPGRGIAFLFTLSGICVVTISGIAFGLKLLRPMDGQRSTPILEKGVTLDADA